MRWSCCSSAPSGFGARIKAISAIAVVVATLAVRRAFLYQY